MRYTFHCMVAVTAVAFAAAGTEKASGQQVVGEYIVGARVISDIALNQSQTAVEHGAAPHVHSYQGVIEGQAVPMESYPSAEGYPTESYPTDSYPSGEMVYEGAASSGCADGNCAGQEVVDGGQGGRAPGRLHHLIHGGEEGQFIPKTYPRPDLFYNYYSNGQNQVNAEMYVAPGPVPPFVGNTWYTYQPFMPHNYLYSHTDRYHNHYDNGRGTNRTRARYSTSPRQYAASFYNFFRLPR